MDLVADENVPRPVILRLRADGYRVVSISESNAGISDVAVLKVSNDVAFVLMTYDRDFGALAIKQGMRIAGVNLLEVERLSLASQIARISECLAEPEAMWRDHFSVIEPGRVRRRRLAATKAAGD